MNKTQLPSWAKGVIGIAITGTAIFIGYKIYTLMSDKQGREDKEREKEAEKSIQDQIVKEGKKVNANFTKAEYIGFANSIYNDLNGCTQSFNKVRDILMKMKNDLDVLNLIKAYGNRQRTCFKINVGGNDDLITTVRNSCSIGCGFINEVNNNWANKKIKYKI
jgi:hypothetical protein